MENAGDKRSDLDNHSDLMEFAFVEDQRLSITLSAHFLNAAHHNHMITRVMDIFRYTFEIGQASIQDWRARIPGFVVHAFKRRAIIVARPREMHTIVFLRLIQNVDRKMSNGLKC